MSKRLAEIFLRFKWIEEDFEKLRRFYASTEGPGEGVLTFVVEVFEVSRAIASSRYCPSILNLGTCPRAAVVVSSASEPSSSLNS